MAAGIVYHNITTSSGVTFSIACWVPNTATPDVGAIPVSMPIASDGTVISDNTGLKISTSSQTAAVANNADGVAGSASLLTVPTVNYLFGWNGTTYDRLQVDANKNLKVINLPGATANGLTASRVNVTASNNLTSLKASAGQIYSIDVFNVAAYTVFLKLYNKASAPVVASDTPVWTIPIQAGGGYSKSFPGGKSFSTGIAYAVVKLQADTDATNVVAGDLTGEIEWI